MEIKKGVVIPDNGGLVKNNWLNAEIVGNGLWPQSEEAIGIEVAHSVVSGGLDDIRAFQDSVLNSAQLARWKQALNTMHKSYGVDIQTDFVYPHFTINDDHFREMWAQLRKDTLNTIAMYIRLSAPHLVEFPPYNKDDMKVITSYLDPQAGSDNLIQLQNFFKTLQSGLHTAEAKKLARKFKENFRNYSGLNGIEKYQREVQNSRLRHSMANRLIYHGVAAGYRQEFVENYLFQTFEGIDPDVIKLVATLPEDAILSP